jgi:hypothetical protein
LARQQRAKRYENRRAQSARSERVASTSYREPSRDE